MKTAALVGWSGNGELDDLRRTVSSKLGLKEDAVSPSASAMMVYRDDPVDVARKLAYLPGVRWVAVGHPFKGSAALTSALQSLAKRYLRQGSTFKLEASVERSSEAEGDVLLDGNGTILKSVKRTRVDEKKPDIVFRVAMTRGGGVTGVQLRQGPGGVPTSRRTKASCLVSGGYHSAVAAWMAALSGYSVTLVHSRTDDESLRQTARLYAELSKRVDATSLSLEVLDGSAAPGERLSAWLGRAQGTVFAGVHPECRGREVVKKFRPFPAVALPLELLQEDEVRSRLDSLSIRTKTVDGKARLTLGRANASYAVRRFGGREADINGVLDNLLG